MRGALSATFGMPVRPVKLALPLYIREQVLDGTVASSNGVYRSCEGHAVSSPRRHEPAFPFHARRRCSDRLIRPRSRLTNGRSIFL